MSTTARECPALPTGRLSSACPCADSARLAVALCSTRIAADPGQLPARAAVRESSLPCDHHPAGAGAVERDARHANIRRGLNRPVLFRTRQPATRDTTRCSVAAPSELGRSACGSPSMAPRRSWNGCQARRHTPATGVRPACSHMLRGGWALSGQLPVRVRGGRLQPQLVLRGLGGACRQRPCRARQVHPQRAGP